MNRSKILWIAIGLLSIVIGVLGYIFLVKEKVDSDIMQVPARVEENNHGAQLVVVNTGSEGVEFVLNNDSAHSVTKVDWGAKWTSLIRERNKKSNNISEVVGLVDITGDGIPEAAIRYCEKSYDSNSASSACTLELYKLEDGESTTSIFKSKTLGIGFKLFVPELASEPGVGAIDSKLKLPLESLLYVYQMLSSILSELKYEYTCVYRLKCQIIR